MAVQSINVTSLVEQQISRRFQWTVALLLCAFMLIEGYDMQVLGYAAPVLIKSWHSSKAALGIVFGGAMLGFMIGALVFANFGDRLGRKASILWGMVVFGVFTLASVCSTSITELLILRTLAGVGLGGSVPNALALMVEYSRRGTSARYISLLYLGYTGGSSLGGLVAAALIPRFGWQSVFIVGGILPLLIAVLLAAKLPESIKLLVLRKARRERIVDMLRRLRPDLALAPDAEVTVDEEVRSGVPARHLLSGSYAVVSLLLWVGYMGNMMTNHFMTSWLPTVVEESGVPLDRAIIATALLQAMGSIGGFAVGYLLDRVGTVGIACTILLGAPCLAGLAYADSQPMLMATVGGLGFFMIGSQTGLNALASTVYPTFMRSTGTGWATGVGRIGAMLGPVIGGALLSLGLDRSSAFLVATVPLLVASAALFALSRTKAGREARISLEHAHGVHGDSDAPRIAA